MPGVCRSVLAPTQTGTDSAAIQMTLHTSSDQNIVPLVVKDLWETVCTVVRYLAVVASTPRLFLSCVIVFPFRSLYTLLLSIPSLLAC